MGTQVQKLAEFACRAAYEDISKDAVMFLKVRILDALGCAIGALGAPPMHLIRDQTDDFGGARRCALIGGGRTAPDRAVFYNSALVRYLDFNDAYLAPDETCHPSDNLGAVLAATEYRDGTGKDVITALAVAYQVQCRLSDGAPVRAKGFDHTTQGAYAVAAGVARALELDSMRTANAIAISGTALNSLRVTRTGALSHWKGLAYANTAFDATHAAFLAMRGINGPLEIFEGNKGFMETIAGPFEIDWAREDLERVQRTAIKRFNAEIHSQSVLEGVLELRAQHAFLGGEVERMELDVFDVAYNIIGGGEEGEKTHVETKEQADHSLPYMAAVAVLDGQVMPVQYDLDRIRQQDVQDLLRKVVVRPRTELSRRFPAEMPCQITITLRDGRTLRKEKVDYEGFHSRPMRWHSVVEKFRLLAQQRADPVLQNAIVELVANLEDVRVSALTRLLEQAHPAVLGAGD